MAITIIKEDWEDSCKRIFRTTQSKYWKEFAWKINMRVFATPKITSKYSSSGRAECWRECGEQEAHHSHIFYFCPVLKKFWGLIQEKTISIFNLKKPLHPLNIILGIIPAEIESRGDKYLYTIIRIAALKQITWNWMNVKAPSINVWKLTVEDIKEMERITYKLRNREDEFMRFWSKWVKETDGVE